MKHNCEIQERIMIFEDNFVGSHLEWAWVNGGGWEYRKGIILMKEEERRKKTFFKKKTNFLWPLFMDGVQLPQQG